MPLPIGSSFMQPETVASHFHFREGDVIADFGAGGGNFTKILSKLVGATGKVYACEIQKALVDKLGLLKNSERLGNVEILWSDLEAPHGTKLADGILDAGILVNTLFQLENKEAAFREIARTLRKGAKLLIVDWTDSFGGIGPAPQHVFREDAARSLAESTGFSFDRTFPAGDHHYGLAMRRV